MNAYNDHTRMQSDELTYAHHQQHQSDLGVIGGGGSGSGSGVTVDSPNSSHSTANSLSQLKSGDSPPSQSASHSARPSRPQDSLSLLCTSPALSDGQVEADMSVMSPLGTSDGQSQPDAHAALTSQSLNTDGTPKRPMNAFMIFARRRRPQVSAANQMMRTGEISKILSREWNGMHMSDKQFYLDQAKKLKENFNSRYPDYVYRRRPNNSRKRRRTGSVDSPGFRGDDEGEGVGDDDSEPRENNSNPSNLSPDNASISISDHIGLSINTHGHHRPLRSPDASQLMSAHSDGMFDFARSAPAGGGFGDMGMLPYPERFDQLSWPPLNRSASTNALLGSSGNRMAQHQHHRSSIVSLALSSPGLANLPGSEPHPVESSTPWGTGPSSSKPPDTLKIDTMRGHGPGSSLPFAQQANPWYGNHADLGSPGSMGNGIVPPPPQQQQQHIGGGPPQPTRHRSLSNLKTESYTPTIAPRPWSSSTSSGSSDTNSSTHHQPSSAMSPHPFDALGTGFYPSPTSAAAQAQSGSSTSYFASSSGAGSGPLGSHHQHHHTHHHSHNRDSPYDHPGDLYAGQSPPLSASSSVMTPNYLPTPSSRSNSSSVTTLTAGTGYDPAPRSHAHGLLNPATMNHSPYQAALHHHHHPHGSSLGW